MARLVDVEFEKYVFKLVDSRKSLYKLDTETLKALQKISIIDKQKAIKATRKKRRKKKVNELKYYFGMDKKILLKKYKKMADNELMQELEQISLLNKERYKE